MMIADGGRLSSEDLACLLYDRLTANAIHCDMMGDKLRPCRHHDIRYLKIHTIPLLTDDPYLSATDRSSSGVHAGRSWLRGRSIQLPHNDWLQDKRRRIARRSRSLNAEVDLSLWETP